MMAEPLSMRLATDEELRNILNKMKSSPELTFDFIRHQADLKDTSYALKRYYWHEIEILKELNKSM